jgi:hypothetical protein
VLDSSSQPALTNEQKKAVQREKRRAIWQKWSSGFRATLFSAWTRTVIGAILGIVLAWAVDAITIHIEERPFHSVWDSIIGNQGRIPIVIGGIKQGAFRPEFTPPLSESKLPDNVHLIGVQDAIASSLLQQRLVKVYGKDSVISEPEVFSEIRSTFVSVGGWSVNATTYDILVQRKIDAKFHMFYPEHYAVDEADAKKYETAFIELENGKKSIIKDYGFIIIGPNPYDREKMVCLVFGIWPQGTSAALEALIEPDIKSDLGREFIKKVQARQGVLAVVDTEVKGFEQGRPVFRRVRVLVTK